MVNHPNRSKTRKIIEVGRYEVTLDVEPPLVQVVKRRKALPHGYSYAPGADTYRSTIKVGSQNWKWAVNAAREQNGAGKSWRVFVNGNVTAGPVLAPDNQGGNVRFGHL